MDKKDGNGSHNWGTFEDEIKAEDDKANVSASDESPAENTEQKEKTEGEVTELDAEAEAKKAAEEEEARTMTLDEWKAQQAGAKEDKPKFNVRKAGEGSDLDPKWKKTYAYKKEKETHEDDEDDVSCLHDCLFLTSSPCNRHGKCPPTLLDKQPNIFLVTPHMSKTCFHLFFPQN